MSIEDLQPVGKPGSILGMVFESDAVIAARARAHALIEQAKFNEAIKLIEQLEIEVTGMNMPERFSRTAKPSESVYNLGVTNPILVGLPEDEYKRQTLLIALRQTKADIISKIGELEDVILDIEATKEK